MLVNRRHTVIMTRKACTCAVCAKCSSDKRLFSGRAWQPHSNLACAAVKEEPERLQQRPPPDHFGLDCLQQAVEAVSTKMREEEHCQWYGIFKITVCGPERENVNGAKLPTHKFYEKSQPRHSNLSLLVSHHGAATPDLSKCDHDNEDSLPHQTDCPAESQPLLRLGLGLLTTQPRFS